MDFGFAWFTRGPLANAAGIRALAAAGDRLNYAYMVVPDHVVIPTEIDSTYPYSADGSFPGSGLGECMDVLTAISYASALTERLRFLTSVMVVPHRPALLTAKIISTIDNLSGGRITVGCGAGWMEEEFKALQLPDYAARGRVTNEYLDVFRTVWTNELASHDGEFVKFSNVSTRPLPVQDPHPPLWIGGESAAALRRVAHSSRRLVQADPALAARRVALAARRAVVAHRSGALGLLARRAPLVDAAPAEAALAGVGAGPGCAAAGEHDEHTTRGLVVDERRPDREQGAVGREGFDPQASVGARR